MTTKLNPGKPDGGVTPAKRCPICDWPIVPKTETGCWEGNCAYRPHEGTAEYYRIKKRREELAAPSPQPSAEATPLQHTNCDDKDCRACDELDGIVGALNRPAPSGETRGTRKHGVDCKKEPHVGRGYLHSDEDDTPYDVDGVMYCGRCHEWVGKPLAPEATTEVKQWDTLPGLPKAELENLAKCGAPGEAVGTTRFADFDDDDHPFRKWWEEHGQFMLSGGGRRESIWAARGWIAREQLGFGAEVTGDFNKFYAA